MVLTLYNKRSCDETMMVKGYRRSSGETTVRKTHQEDVEKITKEIAKKLGLNERIVGIMAKHHDIGHTFLGHSGEWWISSIQEDDGLGQVCHNAVGARELVFTERIYDQIIEQIRTYNPKISKKELERIRDSLWLIVDGINTHNGEKPEKEFVPNTEKTESDFEEEMLNCYAKKGYDRLIEPATSEACLMRLADQISYIPLDMADGLREGLVRDENGNIVDTLDSDYAQVLTELGIEQAEIERANREKDYSTIVERIKAIFTEDVILNSSRNKITMSPRVMGLMNRLRNLNNEKAVDNVVLKEDQQTYPMAIRQLRDKFSRTFVEFNLANAIKGGTATFTDYEGKVGETEEAFIKYILKSDRRDMDFTEKSVKRALRESIGEELDIARKHALEGKAYEDKEELGISYDKKNTRIRQYITYYQKQLQAGKMIGYNDRRREEEVLQIYNSILQNKSSESIKGIEQRIADVMAGKYIASLNDSEFMALIEKEGIISPKEKESLTRKYREIPDLKGQVYIQSAWKDVTKLQRRATRTEEKPDGASR